MGDDGRASLDYVGNHGHYLTGQRRSIAFIPGLALVSIEKVSDFVIRHCGIFGAGHEHSFAGLAHCSYRMAVLDDSKSAFWHPTLVALRGD